MVDAEYGERHGQWQCHVDGERESLERDESECDGHGGGSDHIRDAGGWFGHLHGDADQLECDGGWWHAKRDRDCVAERCRVDGDERPKLADGKFTDRYRQRECDPDGGRNDECRHPHGDGDGGGSDHQRDAGGWFGHVHGDADDLECAGGWGDSECDGDDVAE